MDLWLPPKPAIIRAQDMREVEEWRRAARATLHVNQLIGFGGGEAVGGGNDSFTKFLLHCDGSNGGTSFPDSSAANHTVGRNVVTTSTSQLKFGTASAAGTTSGSFLNVDGSSDFAFSNGTDFTIDFWMQLTNSGATNVFYDSRPAAGNGFYITLYVNSGVLTFFTNSAAAITGGTPSTGAGVWHHVALARSGTNTKMFLDGTQTGSTLTGDTTSYLNAASTRPVLLNDGNVTSTGLIGFMDEIRVSNGIARWTANFTPPTVPYF